MADRADGFVDVSRELPDVVLDLRYYTDRNFIGKRIIGYEYPIAILTRAAADALSRVCRELAPLGYRVKIFDAYRPQRAVDMFKAWSLDASDTRMKSTFYPNVDKSEIISRGYIAERSSHSRCSTVDVTMTDAESEEEADMGSAFDHFDVMSHSDFDGLNSEQARSRKILRDAMTGNGFRTISSEWWHFTLIDEPYPDTYFDVPLTSDALTYLELAANKKIKR